MEEKKTQGTININTFMVYQAIVRYDFMIGKSSAEQTIAAAITTM